MAASRLVPWILLLASVKVQTFPNGAPASTCVSGVPHHKGSQQQSSASPFQIQLSQTNYNPGDVITVTLTSSSGTEFEGFVLRALRKGGQNEELVGEFTAFPDGVKGLYFWPDSTVIPKTINCLTHIQTQERTTLSATWRAPSSSKGDIVFIASVLQSFEKFWVSGTVATLQANRPQTSPHPSQIFGTIFPELSLDGECGRTKGCFLYPDWCSGNDCRYAVSFKPDQSGSSVAFEVTAITPGYVSFGISKDKQMPMAQTVTCVAVGDIKGIQNGFLPAYHLSRRPIMGFTNMQVDRHGDRVTCRFTRPMKLNIININRSEVPPKGTSLAFDLRDDWYIFLAIGHAYEGTEDPMEHDALPVISTRMAKFVTSEVVRGRSLFPALTAHASLGLISWMAIAATSVIIARHYRPTLSQHVGGAAWWFQIHRGAMILMVILSAAGVIVILVHNKGWEDDATVHGAFGLVALGIGLIQIIEGFLRPGITSPRRPIFAWIHRIGGITGWICAVICIFIAFRLDLIDPSLRMRGTIIIAVWLVFYVIWDVVLEIVRCLKDRATVKPEPASATNGLSVQETRPGAPTTSNFGMVHVVFLIVGGLLVLTFLGLALAYVIMS